MELSVLHALKENIAKVLVGNEETTELLLVALLAKGHVLLEDVPGTGKTTLAKSLARSLDADFGRIQFTPDLLPSDVTGLNYFDNHKETFVFAPGPVFCNILLADEINRATPKTQSSLLECMEERQVTVDGVTRLLLEPFLVIATQNPLETLGTFPLPEAQLDRFLMQLSMEPLDKQRELSMLTRFLRSEPLQQLTPVCDRETLLALQDECRQIYIHPELLDYMVNLTQATRRHPKVASGASPRATLALMRASQGLATLSERTYVVPEDIKKVAVPVLAHRLILITGASAPHAAQQVIEDILASTAVPTEDWKER